MRESSIWVGSVVIDCVDLARMIRFWKAALRYVPRDPPGPEGVVLKDPRGRGPNVSLYPGARGRSRTYRLHLDLYSARPEQEVRRLRRLGAELIRPAAANADFVTLSDPDGNVFDVIDKRGWAFGRRA